MNKTAMDIMPFANPGTLIPLTVSEYFSLDEGAIFQKTRKREILMPRQIAIWLEHHEYQEKYAMPGHSVIARAYGFDHATIMHCIKTVNCDMSNPAYLKMIYKLQEEMYGEVKYKKSN